jgi:hypothetical protein
MTRQISCSSQKTEKSSPCFHLHLHCLKTFEIPNLTIHSLKKHLFEASIKNNMKVNPAVFLAVSVSIGYASARAILPTERFLMNKSTQGAYARNWWEFGLNDPIAEEVALFYLGHTWFQGADVGEVLETVYRTNVSDPWSWNVEFTKTAERLEAVGREFEDGGKLCRSPLHIEFMSDA